MEARLSYIESLGWENEIMFVEAHYPPLTDHVYKYSPSSPHGFTVDTVSEKNELKRCQVFSQETILQLATSKMCNFQSGNFPEVRLGLLSHRRLKMGPSVAVKIG